MDKLKELLERLHTVLASDDIFHDNEVLANRVGRKILSWNLAVLVLIMLLAKTGVFPLSWKTIWVPCSQAIVEVAVLVGIGYAVKDDAWWLKYVLIIGICVVYARLDGMLTHKTAILMVIPVIFSSRYFSRNITNFTSVFCTVIFALSAFWGSTHGMIDLNIVTMEAGTPMTATGGFLGDTVINAGVSADMLQRNTMLFSYLPKWLMFLISAIISSNLANNGREMILSEHEQEIEAARIESELDLARKIQENMLPSIYPAFPGRSEFDVYATMTPAKEVGGDFYDFFLIDDDRLGIVIADVSGKGVPAALFMMISKIIVKNTTENETSPARVLEQVNAQFSRNNREEMFVTLWLGILQISTGTITAANAGHEYPIFMEAGGDFAVIRDKHGFVLGGMEGMKYQNYEIQMTPGAKLFLYTDGVSEANNEENELFGIDRIVTALNGAKEGSPVEILRAVDAKIQEFVGETPQFDDLTMLCLTYNGPNVQTEGKHNE